MDKIVAFIAETKLYTEFFANLPEPLNNIYFMLLLLGLVVFMLVMNLFEYIVMIVRHRKVSEMTESKPRNNSSNVNESMMGFLAAMQYAYMAKQKQKETVVDIEEKPANYIEQKETFFEATMREHHQKERRRNQIAKEKEEERVRTETKRSLLAQEELE